MGYSTMENNKPLKAIHAKIQLGDISLDGYKAQEESSVLYFCSKKQIVDLLELDHRRFAQLVRLELAKNLIPQGLEVRALQANHGRIQGIPVHQVSLIWVLASSRNNKKAALLLAACSTETLERKFDKEFGIVRTEEERDEILRSRILDNPQTWSPMFELKFEQRLAKVSGYHKNDIRNGKFYWEFVYNWMTPEERAKMDQVNPVLPNGRRRYKVHQMLDDETKSRIKPHVDAVFVLMGSAKSISELRRLLNRQHGIDQINLFDGWNIA
jgi:hypothetical protein